MAKPQEKAVVVSDSKQVDNIIDELLLAFKKATANFFNIMVKQTTDAAGELTDKGVKKLKQKLEKKDSPNDQKKNC